ncbi:MAG: thioesterase family protein [Candidatus Methanomethylophilaceae archaeon]|jgi:fluoroacetyl-CoA thioesterase
MEEKSKGLRKGIRGTGSEKVTEERTALGIGSGTLRVYGTPAASALAENTAYRSVSDFLEEGQCTVGSSMSIKHLAPTYLGGEVVCETELTEVDGRRLVFSFSLRDSSGLIAEGVHERYVTDCARFTDKAKSRLQKAESGNDHGKHQASR